MNKKPATYKETITHYNRLIKSQIKQLRIYKNHDEYYQIGLIALWDAFDGYDETKGSFSNYAFHVVRGRLMTKLSSEKKYESRYQPSESLDREKQIDEPIFLEKEIIEEYCEDLSPNQKKVMVARCYEDKSFEQIAKEEGVQVQTVRSWYRYACEKLRKKLKII